MATESADAHILLERAEWHQAMKEGSVDEAAIEAGRRWAPSGSR